MVASADSVDGDLALGTVVRHKGHVDEGHDGRKTKDNALAQRGEAHWTAALLSEKAVLR